MDIKEIEQLAEIMRSTGLTSLSIREKDTEIELERQPDFSQLHPNAATQIIGCDDGPASILVRPTPSAGSEPVSIEGNVMTSPTVGVFYASASPDSEPYVQIGSQVKKGDILCLIEAMKLMNEITSDFDGIIAEVCVGNGQVVEYGQPLFRIVAT